ncbi:phorbol esters/diacylglycerol binding domain (c1 domain) domain containing protein [Acanthamoeba castellanii str. Neff]|uniref:Kinase n=1 Tax=Acanthamoeba castellanii (strain ATCC 30010 / Neff) TaxID=1257118 RepID=L8GE29_ACACF|nr:phorbol esters/diacylglycerol binding domain (c1 domain) domain containing protein [Acanthamoeba castellanii str. Neff]ELR10978.1 phorbol esters/diacylglycerol binding domain (c1 domain) domain containing protein [Acanthamoeba castellanii str. Neff]
MKQDERQVGGSLRSITAIKEIIKSPFTLIYRKLGEGGEAEGEPEDKEKAGVVRLSKEGLEVKLKEGEESSDEEIEDLQHVAAATSAAGGSSLYVSQPHQWEKVDFATFSWCKYCGKYLFPLSPGFACQRGCNYTVHKGKCMEAASRSRSGRPDSHLDTFQNQVGGHKGKAAFLKDLDGGKILKPLCPVEFQFYSVLAKLASSDHEGSGVTCEGIDEMKTRMGNAAVWEHFFPRFHGAAQTSEGDDSVTEHYIVMEDLTAGYKYPCICDLKIGARGYDDKASTKKILQQKLLCSVTTSSTLGFRMCGMQYWQNEQRSYVVRDKLWGCKLKENTMQGALVQFLDNGDGVRFPLILNWLAKMKRIEKWFEVSTTALFRTSALTAH